MSDAAFTADRGDDGHRLDHAVIRRLGGHGLSRARVQRLIAAARVLVNEAPARRPAQRLRAGDTVRLDIEPPRPRRRPAAEALPIDVLYEDDDLVAVHKPAGQVVHPSHGNLAGTTINALLGLAARRGAAWQPHLVQRLDKGTSGVLVAAKSAAMQTALQRAAIEKEYLALVWGRPRPPQGRIDTPLGRDPLDPRRVVARASGAAAASEYRTLARSRAPLDGLTLLACRLITGRTHQLRVHLADRGWPLVGDAVYRVPARLRLANPRLRPIVAGLGRQALHAWHVRFVHPRSGARLIVEAPPPDDLRRLLAALDIGS